MTACCKTTRSGSSCARAHVHARACVRAIGDAGCAAATHAASSHACPTHTHAHGTYARVAHVRSEKEGYNFDDAEVKAALALLDKNKDGARYTLC